MVLMRSMEIKLTMNNELSDVMMESVHDIFQGFLALELLPGKEPTVTAQQPHQELWQTSVVIGFTGALRGHIIMSAPTSTALILAGALAGVEFASWSAHVSDLMGELTDLIAGGVRTRLSSYGEMHLTPPIVMIGERCVLNNARIFSKVRQFFQVNGGNFCMDCFYLKDFS